ncbi:HET-domain-containing protein, partial [Ophiobolus disseminans]
MKEVENNTAAIDQTLEPRSRELGTVYRCLSYTWGESPAEHQILLNGDTFCVRKNLFEFLEIAVRLLSYDLLWVDAICIDQTNVTERGHQVKRMDIIYKGAVQVLIWLGNSS